MNNSETHLTAPFMLFLRSIQKLQVQIFFPLKWEVCLCRRKGDLQTTFSGCSSLLRKKKLKRLYLELHQSLKILISNVYKSLELF